MSNIDDNILALADEIVNHRSEEKSRQYGPFGEGMERAAMIASGMTGKDLTAHDMFAVLVALKFSRQSYFFKKDNLLDAAAYIGAWQNYINESENDQKKESKDKQKKCNLSRLVPPSNYSK